MKRRGFLASLFAIPAAVRASMEIPAAKEAAPVVDLARDNAAPFYAFYGYDEWATQVAECVWTVEDLHPEKRLVWSDNMKASLDDD